MRGTANLLASLVTGNPLPPDEMNDAVSILTSADDDVAFDLFAIDPPASASSTNVAVGYAPLRDGAFVTANGGARQVTVAPARYLRSSISNASPRAILSAVASAAQNVAVPAQAASGHWGFELLYAQVAYIDASNPTKGSQVSLHFAPSPTYGLTSAAPNFAALPANTSTTWNIPLRWVRNLGGQASTYQVDVIEVAPSVVSSFAGDLRKRVVAKLTGFSASRAYSSANNDPVALVSGGSSVYAAGGSGEILTSIFTPVVVPRGDIEVVTKEILLSAEVTGLNGGAQTFVVVDDTRDWRGANFVSDWFIQSSGALGYRFGEEDAGLLQAHYLSPLQSGAAIYKAFGQSWNPFLLGSQYPSNLWAAAIGADVGNAPVNGQADFIPTGDAMGLGVDATSGALKFYRRRVGSAAAGPPIYVVVTAFFGNHRP